MKEKTLGDRMKRYEMEEAGRRLMLNLPIMARLDGRAFHSFTRGLDRPFDSNLANCMVRTTCRLVDEFNATLGYTQSDEISLFWANANTESEMAFDGRYHKLVSLLASYATRQFGRAIDEYLPSKSHLDPQFDCRVWQVPNMMEVYNSFLWREDDATRNSLQMAAQSFYSHKELHRKNSPELHDMLHAKGVNWNNYPTYFKRGTYARRMNYETTLTPEQLSRIPVKRRPTGPVVRSAVFPLAAPSLRNGKDGFATFVAIMTDDVLVPPKPPGTSFYHPFNEAK